MPATPLMTADEFFALPEPELGQPRRVLQLVEGEVVVDQPLLAHQQAVLEIAAELHAWTRSAEGRGRATLSLDVKLDDRNVYVPDLMWFAPARGVELGDVRPYPVPDIAVEVRSPSTWRHDIGAKKRGYEQQGLPELWLVDGVAGVVLVFRRSTAEAPVFDVSAELSSGDVLTSPQLPGFELPVASIFI